ncbi:MAG: flavin reductase family protein [Halioglobus sp.]
MTLDPLELRGVLGQFATGVCLITLLTDDGRELALTVNSFASVSLAPPLVLWSLQEDSEVYTTYCEAKHYAINVLSADQQALSSYYAGKDQHEIQPGHARQGEHGVPLINGAVAVLECELEATHVGGDHLIIVGRVQSMHNETDNNPLVFHGGQYRQLAI